MSTEIHLKVNNNDNDIIMLFRYFSNQTLLYSR
jgi:hypothetical protein